MRFSYEFCCRFPAAASAVPAPNLSSSSWVGSSPLFRTPPTARPCKPQLSASPLPFASFLQLIPHLCFLSGPLPTGTGVGSPPPHPVNAVLIGEAAEWKPSPPAYQVTQGRGLGDWK